MKCLIFSKHLKVQKLPKEVIKNHILSDENETIIMLKHFDIDYDPCFITAALKAIFFVQLHGREIGDNNLKEVMQFLIESLANKVIQEELK